MSSLADEFLADIVSDEDEAVPGGESGTAAAPAVDAEEEEKSGDALACGGDAAAELAAVTARVRRSLEGEGPVKAVLDRVAAASAAAEDTAAAAAAVDAETEVARVAAANAVAAGLARDTEVLHRRLREVYAARFPELESLVPAPADYARAVRLIGNATDVAALPLADVLPHTRVVGIAISATTTRGRALPPPALAACTAACDTLLALAARRQQVADYVAARMRLVAPNIAALVGPALGAQLLVAAGGVRALAALPAGTVQLLGQARPGALAGLSTRAARPHTGLVYAADVVQAVPPEARMRASRVLAGKVALAARVDAARAHPDGALGRAYRAHCAAHMDAALAPPPVRADKPLPAPDARPRTRRGGTRLRRAKERLAVTELRRQQNRVAFNAPEPTFRETGVGFGMLGVAGSGRVSVAAVDRGILRKVRRDAAAAARTTPGLRSSVSAARAVGTVSGLTTVAFTPAQGLELANPSAAAPPPPSSLSAAVAHAQSAPDGYFSSINPFTAAHK